jgi:membrane-bound ClpP family serine protease
MSVTVFLVYFFCFVFGLLFTIASAFMSGLFSGHEPSGHEAQIGSGGHAEGGMANYDMPGFSPLSPTVLASFVTAFGALGMILSKISLTQSPWINIPLSLLGGLGIAAGVFFVFQKIFQATQSSSEAHVSDLKGTSASVITPIPENGVGEIAYVCGGSRYSNPARSVDGRAIPDGTSVIIVKIVGSQYYVQINE